MTLLTRIGVALYMLALTLGLIAGRWPLQGPQLIGVGRHGLHVGDVAVLTTTAIASLAVLTSKR